MFPGLIWPDRMCPTIQAGTHAKTTISSIKTGCGQRDERVRAGEALLLSRDLQSLGIFDPATAQLLAGDSAVEAARHRMRPIPFAVQTPRQLDSGTAGGWIPEGGAIPPVSFLFDALMLKPALVGSIVVFSNVLLRARVAEPTIRDAALAAHGRAESMVFLDPSVTAVDGLPASITASDGSTEITATSNLADDLRSLIAAISTSGRGLAWLASLKDLAIIAAALGAAADVPRSLLGLPIVGRRMRRRIK